MAIFVELRLGPYRVAGALGQEARYPFPLRQRAPAAWLASPDIGRSYLSRCFIRGIRQCWGANISDWF
jgi:hypothetical protein